MSIYLYISLSIYLSIYLSVHLFIYLSLCPSIYLSILLALADGMCRGEPLSDRGKRLKMMKILSVTLLPILSLWAFTVYSLSDSIQGKVDIEQVGQGRHRACGVKVVDRVDGLRSKRSTSSLWVKVDMK